MQPFVVLYHHIGKETLFEKGLNVTTSLDRFRQQIDYLSRHYEFVGLDSVISGRLSRKSLLITFDDAFRSVLDAARDVLHPRGIPSVLFVNPSIVTRSDGLSLDSAVAWAANTKSIDWLCKTFDLQPQSSVGALIGDSLSKLGSEAREKIRLDISALVAQSGDGADKRAMTLSIDDLRELPKYGVEIGNHTASHVHCRSLSDSERQTEIAGSKNTIEEWLGRRVRSFSVPYGNQADLTPEVLKLLRASGHELIFLVHGRMNILRRQRDVMYRVSLHDETPEQLRRKLWLEPLARTVVARVRGR